MEAVLKIYRIKHVYVPSPELVVLGLGSNKHEEEIIEVLAPNLNEARRHSMFYNTIEGDGRLVLKYDENGNELFAGRGETDA